MKAMILAAGRGKRLRPLTDTLPKALVEVQGEPLIVHHIKRLVANDISDIVINLAHLGGKIQARLGDGHSYGANITYSLEGDVGYETGGGIVKALPLLGLDPFIVINSDVFCPYNFKQLPALKNQLAHLILVPNPAHNLKGDYALKDQHLFVDQNTNPYTYSGIALYHPALFENCELSRYSVTPLIQAASKQMKVTGECFQGIWHDVGTMERLRQARQEDGI